MPSYQVRDLMCDFQKVIPGGFSQLTTQARLDSLPGRQSTFEMGFSGSSQTQPAFPPVFAATFCDPALSGHDSESSTECRTVDHEHFAELALRHFCGEREHLQDGELGGPQTHRSQRVLIELGKGARRPAEVGAQARQFRCGNMGQLFIRSTKISVEKVVPLPADAYR